MRTVVTGMHRSGSSAVMRVVHALGANLGPEEDLMPAAESNRFGHFELVPFVELNDRLLAAVGSHWAAPAHDSSEMRALASEELGAQAAQLLESVSPTADVIVKDPRFSLTLPLWRQVFDDTIEQIILPFRHPRAVASSLESRNGLSHEYGYALWEWYHLSLFDATIDLPIFPLDFAELIDDPEASCDLLAEWVGLSPTTAQRTSAVQMIEPRARSHVYANTDHTDLPNSTIELWESLQEMKPGESVAGPGLHRPIPELFASAARAITLVRAEVGSQVVSAQAARDQALASIEKATTRFETAQNTLVGQLDRAERDRVVEAIQYGKHHQQLEAEVAEVRAALADTQQRHHDEVEEVRRALAETQQRHHDAAKEAQAALDDQHARHGDEVAKIRTALADQRSLHQNEKAQYKTRTEQAEIELLELRGHVQRVEGERDHFVREFESERGQREHVQAHNNMLRNSKAGRLVFGWWSVRNRLTRTLTRARALAPGSISHSAQEAQQESEHLPAPVHVVPVDRPDVSIVIPVYGQLVYTERCLRSLVETLARYSFEVIVVNDKSPDATAEWLETCSGIKIVSNEENLGYLRSTNAGAAVAAAPRLLLLNNDTAVHPGWLDALCELLDSADDVGAVGAKLYYEDGSLQEAGSIIWNDARGWNYGRGQNPDDYRFNFVREVDYCSAACLLIRRSAWDDIGGFDERFAPAYYEDPDLCFSLRARGFRVLYQPAARVTHYEGVSHGTDEESGLKAHQLVNRETFLDKWQTQLADHYGPDESPRLASWRGTGRRVVVFDHEVPTWDRDAGSLRMTAILDLLQEMGFRVTVIPHNRFQLEPYASTLAGRGFEVFHGWDDWHELLREMAPDLAAIIVSRPQVAAEVVPQAASAAPDVPVLYDMVDFHGLRMQRQADTGEDGVAKHGQAVMELERAMVRATDATIAVTEVEAAMVRELEPDANVVVIPLINRSERSTTDFADRSGSMFIGSWRHLPNRDAISYLCTEVMPVVWESDPDHQLHIVGSDMPDDLGFELDDRVTMHGWVEDLEPLYDQMKCNVAPLRFGAGLKGKVADSLIRGVPVVTTAIGAEGFGPVAEALLVGTGPAELAALMLKICADPDEWADVAERGAVEIEAHFGYAAARESLRKALASVGVNETAC